MKDMQELAFRLFNKGKTTSEDTQTPNMEADSRRKQQLNSNSNLSPLARFLLSRLVKKYCSLNKRILVLED